MAAALQAVEECLVSNLGEIQRAAADGQALHICSYDRPFQQSIYLS